jgi:small subunit ribosomal protein S14
MSKKSVIQRNNKKKILINKYKDYRKELKKLIKKTDNFEKGMELRQKLQKLPRNSSQTRFKNRCWLTGRPRAYSRFFGVSRQSLRELFIAGYLPGVIKASW